MTDKVKVGKPLLEHILLCVRAGLPVLLRGRHGVGKSEVLRQACDLLGIMFIDLDLSLLEPVDLVGLPTSEEGRTVYHPPAFLPTDGKGLMSLEELNRCSTHMRAPCLQLLTARKLNGYHLPPGWLVVGSINPSEGYDVFELDSALESRFVLLDVVADPKEWCAWARANDIHADVVRYVESDPRVFSDAASNPRSWTYVSRVLKTAEGNGESKPVIRKTIAGLVGETRARAFLSFLRGDADPIEGQEVVERYSSHRAKMKAWVNEGRLDMVEATLHNVLALLQCGEDYQSTRTNRSRWSNLGKFIHDLPGDLCEQAKRSLHAQGYSVPRRSKARG